MRLNLSPTAEKDLERMDKGTARLILKRLRWLAENFELIVPIPLKGEFKDLKKFQVGDFRALYDVNRNDQILTVYYVRHRREIYKSK